MEVDLEKDVLTDIASGKQYPLKSIGEVSTTMGYSYSLVHSAAAHQLLQRARTCSC